MSEILMSLSLISLITVSDLKLMTYYWEKELGYQRQTVVTVQSLSAAERESVIQKLPINEHTALIVEREPLSVLLESPTKLFAPPRVFLAQSLMLLS